MKRSTLLLATLVALGLAACGEQPKPAPKPAVKAPEAAAPVTPPAAPAADAAQPAVDAPKTDAAAPAPVVEMKKEETK